MALYEDGKGASGSGNFLTSLGTLVSEGGLSSRKLVI